jgi:hypothetical protein
MRGEYGPVSLRDLLGEKRYRAELAEFEDEDNVVRLLEELDSDVRRELLRNPPSPAQVASHSLAEIWLAAFYNCGARTVRRLSDGTGDE